MSEDNIITAPGNESHKLQAPTSGSDCTGIIEQVAEEISAKNANIIAAIANTMESQPQKMKKITDILAEISQFLVQGNLGQNTSNIEFHSHLPSLPSNNSLWTRIILDDSCS